MQNLYIFDLHYDFDESAHLSVKLNLLKPLSTVLKRGKRRNQPRHSGDFRVEYSVGLMRRSIVHKYGYVHRRVT